MLKELADRRGLSINQLVAEVDEGRSINLSSALRVYVLRDRRVIATLPTQTSENILKNLLASTRGLVALFVSVASEVWMRWVLSVSLVAVSSGCREDIL